MKPKRVIKGGNYLHVYKQNVDNNNTRYKIQETLFRVDIQIYTSVTLAMGYFVDKHSKNSVHVYIR